MSDRSDQAIMRFATGESAIIANILSHLSTADSSIIEIVGPSGSGKKLIFHELIRALNKQNRQFELYAPFLYRINQFEDLLKLLTGIQSERLQELTAEGQHLKIANRYDFFFYLTSRLEKDDVFSPNLVLINEAFFLDQYTLDFIRYLVQYFEPLNIKFVVFTRQEIFPYSVKIPVRYPELDDVNRIISDFLEEKDLNYQTESEIISKISAGNLYIIAYLLDSYLTSDKKMDLGSYLGKKITDHNFHAEMIQQISEELRNILLYMTLAPFRLNEDSLKILGYDLNQKEITALTADKYLIKFRGQLLPVNISGVKSYFDQLPKTRQRSYFQQIIRLFDGENLDEFKLKTGKPEAKVLTREISFLTSILDYNGIRQLRELELETTTEPLARIEILKQLGIANQNLNSAEQGIDHLREALKLSVENSAPAEEVIYHLANNLYSVNSLAFALELIKKYTPSTIDNYWKWKLIFLKAQILMDMEKFEDALTIADEAEQITISIDEREQRNLLLAYTKKLKGLVYYYSYDLTKAEREFEEAERLFRTTNDIAGLAAVYNNLGGMAIAKGEWEKTEKLYLKSLEYEKTRFSLSGISGRYCNLGYLYEDEGDYQKSLDYLNKALKIQKLLDDRDVLTNIYNNIGVTYMDNCKYQEAEESFNRLLEIALKFNMYRNIIAAYNNMGALYFKSGDWNKATDFYERAIRKSQENNFFEGLCKSYNNLGELYEKRWEFNLALDCYKKSQDILPNVSDDFLKAELFGNLGSVYTFLHQYQEAYAHLIDSFDFFKDLNTKDKMLEGAQKLIFYFIQTQNLESANYYLNIALKLSDELNNDYQLGRCLFLQALMEKDDPESAGELLKKAIELFRKTDNEFDLALANYEYAGNILKNDDWELALQILVDNKKIIQSFGAIKLLERNDILIQKIRSKYASELNESSQQESLLNKFYEITQRLNEISDFDILMETALEDLLSFSEADGGAFCLYYNPLSRDSWEYMVTDNMSAEQSEYRDLLGLIIRTYETNELQDLKQPQFAPDYNNIVSFPLSVRNEKKGVILIFSRHDTHYFSEKMINLVSALCNQIVVIVENISFSNLEKSHAVIREELAASSTFANIIGRSPKIQAIFKIIDKIKDTPTTILLEGASGTGKELIARAIHFSSNRRNSKFVAQYCGALPETLLESELFGHVKGSFTGATHDKMGLFEIANGGTFFLDEIADISLSTQAKLLRFLQEGEIKRVGSTKTEHVDVRVICATNVPLKEKVEKGDFRLDLYYRLNVIRIEVPSLVERQLDIPLLAVHFLDKYCSKINKKVNGITDEAMKCLMNYDWPGNIRQLENEIERAVTLAENDTYIKPSDLSEEIFRFQDNLETINLLERKSLKEAVEKLEKQMIIQILEESNWNQTKTAKELGLSRQGLIKKMQRYHLIK